MNLPTELLSHVLRATPSTHSGRVRRVVAVLAKLNFEILCVLCLFLRRFLGTKLNTVRALTQKLSFSPVVLFDWLAVSRVPPLPLSPRVLLLPLPPSIPSALPPSHSPTLTPTTVPRSTSTPLLSISQVQLSVPYLPSDAPSSLPSGTPRSGMQPWTLHFTSRTPSTAHCGRRTCHALLFSATEETQQAPSQWLSATNYWLAARWNATRHYHATFVNRFACVHCSIRTTKRCVFGTSYTAILHQTSLQRTPTDIVAAIRRKVEEGSHGRQGPAA